MSEIFDAIARISWDSNLKELKAVTDEMRDQDKVLEELKRKGSRLENQMKQTNDPAKLARYNNELQETRKRSEAILATQKKQVDLTEELKKKQSELHNELKKNNDPKIAQGLLQMLGSVENKIKALTGGAGGAGGGIGSIGAKIGGLGSSLLSGFGIGTGMEIFNTAVSGITSFFNNAIEEFESAERSARLLQGTLKNLGEEQYFEGLMAEANRLAETFSYLDNDDIVDAQQKLLTYGKLTRQEISSLLPIIIDFSARTGKDIPSATEVVIGALEGQGRALKQYGINMKDADTFTERLALVQGELSEKVKGAAEDFMNSSAGIKAAAEQQAKDVEEEYGKVANEISLFFKEAVTGLYRFISDMRETEEEERAKANQKLLSDGVSQLENMSKKELEFEMSLQATREQSIRESQARQNAIRDEMTKKGRDGMTRKEYKDKEQQLKNEKELQDKYRAEIYGVNVAWSSFEAREKQKQAEKQRVDQERNAAANEEAQKKAAERASEERKRAEEKAKQEQEKINQAYIAAQRQFEDDKAKQTLSAMDYELLKVSQHFEAIKTAYKKVNEDTTDVVLQEEIAKQKIRNKYADEEYKLQVEKELNRRKAAREAALRAEPITSGLAPGLSVSSAVDISGFTSAVDGQKFAQEKAKEKEEKRQRRKEVWEAYKEDRELLYQNLLAAVSVAQQLIAVEQEKNDRLIELQQQRIDNIRSLQEKGSQESLKIEEDRLNELLSKRRRFEQQQRTIDAAVIVANQAVAISAAIKTIAGSKNPVLIAANVLAILAGVGAAVAGIRSAFQSEAGFYVGGYTGDGDPHQTSTAVGRRPYTYHKGEFVMDHDLTAKHRDLFDGLHKRELMVQKLHDGYYVGSSTLDTDRAIADYYTAKNYTMDSSGVVSELQLTNKLLRQGRVIVENNFDVNGFSTSLASQITQTELRRKLVKLG